jgi:hypothetical protein
MVFKAKPSNGRHLRAVVPGLRPMEVCRVARKNNHGAGRIGLQPLSVELITDADVEGAGNDRVEPILGVFVRHQLPVAP